ncbi:hypothetical protein SAMN05428954_6965 [Streptomyces sp. 2112.3]|nr:hypothetical protein SAMN05428954_6965 [Streptomyces sp. 2112.3]
MEPSFGLLTMIVSLESIFLSTSFMAGHHSQAVRDTIRADLNFEAGVCPEVWSTNRDTPWGWTPEGAERQTQELLPASPDKMNSEITHRVTCFAHCVLQCRYLRRILNNPAGKTRKCAARGPRRLAQRFACA